MNWIKTKDQLPKEGQYVLIAPIKYDVKFLVGKYFSGINLEYVVLEPSFACCCENHEEIFYPEEFSHWIALDDIENPID